MYSIRVENKNLIGTGVTVLKNSIDGAQFILIGEQHGIKEVPEFTSALFKQAQLHGFRYICVETDPFIASHLEYLARKGWPDFERFNQEFPMSAPFYSWKEEFEFLHQAINYSTDAPPTFWGIDQVFIASPRFLFSRLAELAHNENARQIANDYLKKAKAAFAEVVQTGNPGSFIMVSLNENDFEKLTQTFHNNPNNEAMKIIQGIRQSQQIYGLWLQGEYYQNNRKRSQLMKQQFMQYYDQAAMTDNLPKVLLKFGSGHMYRGLSIYDQYDVGNMISELAEMKGSRSLHINIVGIKGTASQAFEPPQPFDHAGSISEIILSAIDDKINGSDWVLIDMQPLRLSISSAALQPIRDIVYGYDFLLLIPQASPMSN